MRDKVKMNREEFEKVNVFGLGNANEAYSKYFLGESYLNSLTKASDGIFLANVTFEPGCRNNWRFITPQVVVDRF